MKLDLESGKIKFKPTRDLIAFKWLAPKKTEEGIILPGSYFNLGLQIGKLFIGQVLAIGPKVKSLKPKNKILIHEYGIKDFRGGWKELEIYFIEERFIKAKISGTVKGIL